MSYCNLLFPGNPRRRRQVELYEQLCRKVQLINALTVDRYMDHIKVYMTRQLDFVAEGAVNGLQQACETLLARTASIQENLRTVDNTLKQQLPPNTYEKLQGIAEPKMKDAAKMCKNLVVGLWIFTVMMTVVSVSVFCYYISTVIQILPLAFFVQMNATLVLTLAAVCICFGADVLLSTVIGSWEKHQLMEKIRYYENLLAALPAAPV